MSLASSPLRAQSCGICVSCLAAAMVEQGEALEEQESHAVALTEHGKGSRSIKAWGPIDPGPKVCQGSPLALGSIAWLQLLVSRVRIVRTSTAWLQPLLSRACNWRINRFWLKTL